MYVIVVGCGRVGSQLAEFLAKEGHDVVVVDKDKNSFRRLGTTFNGITIEGVGFDEEVLREAGIEKADAVAAVTNFDNTNAMIAEVTKKLFNVPRAIARLYNPEREKTYQKLGIEYICGTTIVAERMLDKIVGDGVTHLLSEDEIRIVRFEINSHLYGKRASDVERKGKIKVISVIRNEEGLLELEDVTFKEGDQIILAVTKDLIDEVKKLAKKPGD